MFKVNDIGSGKILNYQSLRMKDTVDLCKFINKMFQDGYKIDEDFLPRMCPHIPRLLNMKFVKDENSTNKKIKELEFEIEYLKQYIEDGTKIKAPKLTEEVGEIPDIIEIDIDKFNKKDDLVAFAKSRNIDIPEDVTHPKSIKKFLKDHMGLK